MKKAKLLNVIICIFAVLLGVMGGAVGYTYFSLPDTENLQIGEEIFYSYNNHELQKIELSGANDELSIHFLELGNKYTGDCTYIKVGETDVLIDCGSRSSSIPTVTKYLNQYITDKLDYVVVTHAHQDHYAGFATSSKINGIFELYEVGTIIDFGNATNQKDTSTMYNNYKTKRDAEIENGAKYFTAYECFYELQTEYGKAKREIPLNENGDITLEILYNYYYQFDRTNAIATAEFKASTENDYSICTMINQGDRHFMFTGDLEKDGEKEMVKYYSDIASEPLPQVDVYKAGHHGSGTSSSAELLSMIKPKNVCVCCCAGSPEYTDTLNNQFPTQAFLDRIGLYTTNVFVTTMCIDWENDLFESMNGNIVFISKLEIENLGIKCSNNETVLKDTDWFNKIVIDKDGNERPNRIWNGLQS